MPEFVCLVKLMEDNHCNILLKSISVYTANHDVIKF